MSSIDDRAVVDFVQSLGSPSSSGTISTSTVPDKVSRRELLARINIEEATLLAAGRPWSRNSVEVLSSSSFLHLIHNMTQIRQQDVGKFFIRLKPEYGFIKGNPSSHKGWMSRYFFVRRNVREGIAWYCDMSWAEKPTKRVLPPPIQEYNPIPFIKDACTKCFNARDLIREDLLCHFGFSRKGVAVEGDLAQPVTSTTVAFFQHFIPPLDAPVVSSASDKKITEALASNFLQVLVWGGELSRRLTKAREVAHSSKRSLNDVMAKHDKLMKEIEEVRGASDVEKKSLEQRLTASEASIIRLQEEMKKAGEEAEEKIKRAQEEAEASWEKRKADFLKSDEFDRLCSTRALSFFQHGFDGCLAQIRDNRYSEAEHPFSFLDVLMSLEALPDDGEAEPSGAKK
ncbi:hypothetical protein F511_15725 [Dorcoceras hygrometricum]|uniref:Uncharacterized protein n=1 Tax=Dorcoceras hygrometricum TaxID=472368 RepID=A0A2Z7DB77_9LAMI|nr:hypothetical protein F511_15725 [Dorcoceras hygrometricum]